MSTNWKIGLLALLAGTAIAGESVVLKCEPQILRGMPGEPLKLELTIKTSRAIPARVLIPSVSNLVLALSLTFSISF